MMEKAEIYQKIKLKWKDYKNFNDDLFLTLTKIGYQKGSDIELPEGKWQLFYLMKEIQSAISLNKKNQITNFFAIWIPNNQNRKFLVSGISENLDNIANDLKYIARKILTNFSSSERKFFRFSKNLTVENAQDYGYLRGLLAGIMLMIIDITPWHIGTFRPQGILGTFLEYTRIVYYGTPGFAIVVGMGAIGIYFTVLFILIPIMTGNLFMLKARKIEKNVIFSMPDSLADYDFGKDAEISLNEQYRSLVENIKREEIYKKVVSIWKDLKKEDFFDLYDFFRGGLIAAESLYAILKRITDTCPSFDLKECLKIMIDVLKKDTEVVLKVSEV
ncbi:MAG: hypothetical protein NC906_09745 [Candidatus Omnitrophica bacterium]|nr:hypothetical protein [Candidatus Omnitrophota bacterium]